MLKLLIIISNVLLTWNSFAQSPHGEKLTFNCDACHSSDSWIIDPGKKTFDHNKTTFRLIGQHKTISCRTCHTDLRFANAKTDCISCHKDLHQQTVGQQCERCHTPISWRVNNIEEVHQRSRFPLNGQHSQADCYQCHRSASLLLFDHIGTTCIECHSKEYYATNQPSHVASRFPVDCFLCHNEKVWQPAKFNHNTGTSFPLNGGHLGVSCGVCHTSGYSGVSTVCSSCHLATYTNTTNPAHTSAKFSTDCKSCHTINKWAPATFNHNSETKFPLTGGHIGVSCIRCHEQGYRNTAVSCSSCHLKNYVATTNPNHSKAKFSTDCQLCHNSASWSPSFFNHNDATAFPLKGSHTAVSCTSCHPKGYTGTASDCSSCHLPKYTATTEPDHVLAKFNTDCKTCHTEENWKKSTFNHDTNTSFPLTGSHITVKCISCHTKGYIGTTMECFGCHLSNYSAATSPSHVDAKYPTDCKICHSTSGWTPSIFNHNTGTTFPLTGAHIGAECIHCHTSGYKGTSANCESCHLANYNATVSPAHLIASFPTDCKTCHNATAWKPTSFSHKSNVLPDGMSCYGCHKNEYIATLSPAHITSKISTDCQTCHTVSGWSPATFNHTAGTTFPLTGSHIGLSCVSCHSKGYRGVSTDCSSCHMTNYATTTTPVHSVLKFPTACEICHTATSWIPSTFNHNISTNFPLMGAHIGPACISCHEAGYTGISSTCISCHTSNYNSTTSPGHVAAKFPTDCSICHNVNSWSPSTFNHSTGTSFPLTGSHTTATCISCHSKGYSGISTTCVSCHLTNYNATTNPGHGAARFPTSCETCHTSTGWSPATFNHNTNTAFPLTEAHAGVSCISCHASGYTGISTACISCHLSNFNSTTSPGHVAAKFSTDCKICHTAKAWIPASFNHNTGTTFPLTGAHTSVACIDCHSKGYTGISTLCSSCHLINYNATTNPSHTTAKFPTSCETCHTSNSWSPASFNHNTNTAFPLSGAHIGVACTNCHTNGYGNISTTCVSCHLSNFNATTNPSHASAKFPTTCETCHNPTAWSPAIFNHNTKDWRTKTKCAINL